MQATQTLETLTDPWALRIRWGLFLAIGVAALLLRLSDLAPALVDLTGLAALSAVSGLLAARAAGRLDGQTRGAGRRLTLLYYARTFVDLALVLAAIYLTGGVESPMLLFLIPLLFSAGLEAGIRVELVASLIALGAVAVVAVLQFDNVLLHFHLGSTLPTDLYQSLPFTSSLLLVLGSSILVTLSAARRVSRRVERQQSDLSASRARLGQRVDELNAEREIGQQLAASLHLDVVLDTIGSSALRLVKANDVHLFLYDEATGRFGPGVGVWADGQRRLAVPVPRENGLSRAVVDSAAPVLIDRVENHPLYSTPQAKGWNIKSIAGFPVKKGKRVLGVLNAAFITPHHFTDEERDALMALADQAALAIDNASLYAQVERRARELSALYRVSQSVSEWLDPARLMDQALASVQLVMEVPIGMILVVDESGQELVLAAQRGLPPAAYDEFHSRGLKMGEGLAGQAALTGEPLVVRDACQDPRNVRSAIRTLEIHALASIPLKAKDQVLGVLQVARRDDSEFTPADINLLRTIAQQIAVAVENARLYAETRRRADELASLREIGLAMTSTLELREQLRLLYTQVQPVIRPDSFFVGLYDETRQEIDVQFVMEEGWELRGPIIPLESTGLSPWVIRSRRPLRVDDMDEERERLPVQPRHETRPARSWLGVPLMVRDRVVGILSVQSFRARAFTSADLKFLVSVAQHAALAIENARLYETTEQRARAMALINEISRAISASLDLHEIFQRTVMGLSDVFGYQFVSLYLVQGNELHLQSQIGPAPAPALLSAQTGILGRVLRSGQAAFVRDTRTDPDFVPDVPGVSVEISVPIRRDKRVVGLLDVKDRRTGALSEEDVRILVAFSEHIGIAMANASLYQAVVERERFALSLQRITQALMTTSDAGRVLDILCRESLDFFGVQGAYVWLLQGEELVGAAACGDRRDSFVNLRVSLEDKSVLDTRVVKERQPLFLNEVPNLTDFSPTLRQLFRPLSLIGAPLIVEDAAIGSLMLVEQRNSQRFGPVDLERVTALARQASYALASVRLQPHA